MSSVYNQFKRTEDNDRIYQPIFYRLNDKKDKEAFHTLLNTGKVILYDEIYNQLKELIKSRNPSLKPTSEEYEALIRAHAGSADLFDYGVWVYYPWSGRVVHLLDEAEFIELRTSANRNRITIAEREKLSTKKVGVIGLSVGQSVAVTLAMERSCGELRLADFDTLELNNLNRIRTGVHNLGLLKAYSVAREIAELDPYFKTVCYTGGVTEDNIDDFFTKGGKLDAVIDECDSVDVKIRCRIKAKELNVPVLMEASDRGTMDVERFDLEPGRPIMHGWLEHLSLDFDVLRNLKSNDEKLPYMLPIAGFETLSPRLKASVLEMSVTITTWPQLATAVTLGGALTADTCRRIFLDQYTASGRYFIDLEKLVPDERPVDIYIPPVLPAELGKEDMEEMIKALPPGLMPKGTGINSDTLEYIVSKAIMAPSLHNAQPWKWCYKGDALYLFHDRSKSVSYLDYQDIASHISLGAAIENLEIAAFQKGMLIETMLFPLAGDNRLVAAMQFNNAGATATGLAQRQVLGNFIEDRCTNRAMGTGEKIEEEVLEELQKTVTSVTGAKLLIRDSKEDLKQLSDIIGPSERLKLLCDESHHDFYQAINLEEGKRHDGLDLEVLGLSGAERIGLKIARSPEVIKLLREWNGGKALEYTARKILATASAVGIVTIPGVSAYNCLEGGHAIQRMWLTLTKYNISVYPLQSIITNLARAKRNGLNGLPVDVQQEINNLVQKFRSLIPETNENDAVFLFSMSTCTNRLPRSLKKTTADVLFRA